MEELEAMRNDDCQLCELHLKSHEVCKYGSGALFGLMIVTDGIQSAVAKKLLDHVLKHLSLKENDVYITSLIKCRTPRGKKYRPKEMEEFVDACWDYLADEIQTVKPKAIVLLGTTPLTTLTEHKGITKWTGAEVATIYDGATTYVGVSPAFILRNAKYEVQLAQVLFTAARKAGLNPKAIPQKEMFPYEVF